MLQEKDYEQIEATYKYFILKLFTYICRKQYVESFNILKANYQAMPTRLEHHIEIMVRTLNHAANRRKSLLFKQLESRGDTMGFQRAKASIMLKRVICHRVNIQFWQIFFLIKSHNPDQVLQFGQQIKQTNQQSELFPQFSRRQQKQEEDWQRPLQFLHFQLNLVGSIVSKLRNRYQVQALQCLKLYSNNRKNSRDIRQVGQLQRQKSQGTMMLIEICLRLIWRQMRTCWKNILLGKQPQNERNQHQKPISYDDVEIATQISLIKSIINTNFTSNTKSGLRSKNSKIISPIPSNNTNKDFIVSYKQNICSKIVEMLAQNINNKLSATFSRLVWKAVQGCDEETIDKLQAQIVIECSPTLIRFIMKLQNLLLFFFVFLILLQSNTIKLYRIILHMQKLNKLKNPQSRAAKSVAKITHFMNCRV